MLSIQKILVPFVFTDTSRQVARQAGLEFDRSHGRRAALYLSVRELKAYIWQLTEPNVHAGLH